MRSSAALAFCAVALFCAACDEDETARRPVTSMTGGGAQQSGGAGGGAAGGGVGGTGGAPSTGGSGGEGGTEVFPPVVLTSPAFLANEIIPEIHECLAAGGSAQNLSPVLSWTGGPMTVGSWGVVGRDLDAEDGGVVQWVIWNIPGTASQLPEGVDNDAMPANVAGAIQALSYDDTTAGYVGPCISGNRYAFSVFAMTDATLPNFDAASNRAEVASYLTNFSVTAGHLIGQNN